VTNARPLLLTCRKKTLKTLSFVACQLPSDSDPFPFRQPLLRANPFALHIRYVLVYVENFPKTKDKDKISQTLNRLDGDDRCSSCSFIGVLVPSRPADKIESGKRQLLNRARTDRMHRLRESLNHSRVTCFVEYFGRHCDEYRIIFDPVFFAVFRPCTSISTHVRLNPIANHRI
jgi:hypothetical protein